MPDTILVTGAAGFVGRHLVDRLTSGTSERGANAPIVVGWHRPGHPPERLQSGASWMGVDLLDRKAVIDAAATVRPTVVYHCAGAAHVGQAWSQTNDTFAVNVRGTRHLFNALERAGGRARILIPSSSLVYRSSDEPLTEESPLAPSTPYGVSKLAQELVALDAMSNDLTVLIARAFTHIGPGQDADFSASSFAHQIAQIEAGRRPAEIEVGNLDARRDLTDVRDTVRAYEAMVRVGQPGRPYNICSGSAVKIGSMLEILLGHARVPITIRVDGARLRPSDAPLVVGNPARAERELEWHPQIPLERTLADLLDDWRVRG